MTNHETTSTKIVFDAMFNLAVDCHERGKIEDALDMFRALSFLAPHDPGVWNALARCHEDLGQEETAALLRSLGAQIQRELPS
ncbi:MAG: tetratricopeptide repeat protein [Myxococcales bacterium]|nr:tetratricopeptide repeat protein [Polyangiaceae bacterium]MDW8250360.1 tetratricopeptide repeat protein [Myxococcales bacterium]